MDDKEIKLKPLAICDTCDISVDSRGNVHHEPDCLRQKHNNLKDAVTKALKGLGDAIGESLFGGNR